jgi:hypothetical protein
VKRSVPLTSDLDPTAPYARQARIVLHCMALAPPIRTRFPASSPLVTSDPVKRVTSGAGLVVIQAVHQFLNPGVA